VKKGRGKRLETDDTKKGVFPTKATKTANTPKAQRKKIDQRAYPGVND
jgi:hypothetical protein